MDEEARFRKAVEFVLRHEGGYADHPQDPGGPTRWGISLRYLRGLGLDLGDMDKDGDIDAEDVRRLPKERAVEIYRRQWWDRYGLGRLADADVAAKVMDLMVNTGPSQGVRLLQRALGSCGKQVAVDGVLGPKTVAAANSVPPQQLLAALRDEAAKFYRGLVAQRPELAVFERGWLRRAYA